MWYKEDIYSELERVDDRLKKYGLYLNLKIVGGSALILNDIHSIETNDIDTIVRIETEIKEILDDCSADINDDALDYINNYDNLTFIEDEHTFSNIHIEYLSIVGVIKTKMKDTNPSKLENLYYIMESDLGIDMSLDGICNWFSENSEEPDLDDIRVFLEETQYLTKDDSDALAKAINVMRGYT